MKRTALVGRQLPKRRVPWRESEYAVLRANSAETSDDRTSENLFDAEDERAEVDIIVRGMVRGAS